MPTASKEFKPIDTSSGDKSLLQESENLRRSDPDLHHETLTKHTSTNHKATQDPIITQGRTVSRPFRFIPLTVAGRGTHVPSSETIVMMKVEVSLDDLMKMTNLFYSKAFENPILDKFIRSHSDPHGARFAKWIHQKLSNSTVWDEDRQSRDKTPVLVANSHKHIVHDRTSAHVAAWYSPKRPSNETGRHFELDECRLWMRLHFWALRESGLADKSPTFADYYVRFIAHFVRVYESSAPIFARDSWRWSSDLRNTEQYMREKKMVPNIMGLSLEEAEAQIPESEANDFEWPYNQTFPSS